MGYTVQHLKHFNQIPILATGVLRMGNYNVKSNAWGKWITLVELL